MKYHIFELRRKILIYGWSSQLYTQLKQLWNSKARNSYEFLLSHGNYRAIKLNILRTVMNFALNKISWRIVLPAFQWFSRWLVKAIGATGPNWNKSPHRSHDTYSRGQKCQLKIFTGFKMFSINQWEFIRTCESFQYKLSVLAAAKEIQKYRNETYKLNRTNHDVTYFCANQKTIGWWNKGLSIQ